jgi:tetratricopeptide (TPR) repeat protein
MARSRRVPYRPDGFQRHGHRVVGWIRERATLFAVALVVMLAVFVVALVLAHVHEASEERAWKAYEDSLGDLGRLEAAVDAYGSTLARPYKLLALANALKRRPLDEEGEPLEETEDERRRRLERAEDALRDLLEDHSDHVLRLDALSLLGLILEEQGRHREAIEALQKALEAAALGAADPRIRYDIGRNYVLSGDEERARVHLKEALSRSSGEAMWRQNARYLLARTGRGERTIRVPGVGERKPVPAHEEDEEREGGAGPAAGSEGTGAAAGEAERREGTPGEGKVGEEGREEGPDEPAPPGAAEGAARDAAVEEDAEAGAEEEPRE